ncbi:monocarboxylate transporter 4 isoform X2 [Heliangelus exortis]|uniref:monocarboxylate transporter 4 isoform X2 n=1 Tax=Heliangelus exortis TaxID=472823 RepID=UPI003A92D8B6
MGAVVVDDGPSGVKAPDGGWGWAVLFGCFIITGFSYAFPKAVSVFFKELIREFGIGYSDTAWISSILLAMLYGTGPLCSVCVNRFGCRPVMLVGGLFASMGMVTASFCTSIIQIYFTAGVITGLGLALNFQPSLIMLNRYFDKRRPLANGLSAAGSPVFLCALSPLGQILQHEYGWRGGFLILGALQFEVLMAIVGTQKFSSAIGLVLLAEAMAVLIGPPSAGKLLDATGRYMFVFITAGTEVTTSAFVLALGNFFCIKKKSEEPHTKDEAKVDSIEVEQFLKDEPEKNGKVVTNPETCV